MCAFSKGEKPSWSLGARFEASSQVSNKALLFMGVW